MASTRPFARNLFWCSKNGMAKAASFDIEASVVFQLGEELISNNAQALLELAKNAYDADATTLKILIDTNILGATSEFPMAVGMVRIEDNGLGMTRKMIEDGWLVISGSQKRESKRRGESTPRGRTPLGDKGLGRLGVQRIGTNVEVVTKHKQESKQHRFAFTWDSFAGLKRLGDVPIVIHDGVPTLRRGTTIIVTGLRDAAEWRGPEARDRLELELSRLISPYEGARDFEVIARIDGQDLHLRQIHKQARGASDLRYDIEFDGSVMKVTGRVKLAFLMPPDRVQAEEFEQLVDEDGSNLLDHLLDAKQARRFKLAADRSSQWLARFSFSVELADIKGVTIDEGGEPVSPGPFEGSIDSFDLGSNATQRQSVFDKPSEFKRFIKEMSGIRVYRDGFGVRVDYDWLKLAQQGTSGGSYYGLKPGTTVGYVALSAGENAALVETTDREGFVRNPAYENFERLMDEFVSRSGQAQEFLRREWLVFKADNQAALVEDADDHSPEGLTEQLVDSLDSIADGRRAIASVGRRLEAAGRQSEKLIARLEASGSDNRGIAAAISEATRLQQLNEEVLSLLHEADANLAEVEDQRRIADALGSSIELLRNQLDVAYETMSLGLTAEALMHEIENVANGLGIRTENLIKKMQGNKTPDAAMVEFVEHVRGATSALRRQLSHFSPALRYVRERRESIDLCIFAREIVDFYEPRWSQIGIGLELRCAEPFKVRVNRGKLTQIFDNLLLNSEYWLTEDLRAKGLVNPKVSIAVRAPLVLVRDNGRGIDASVEDSLFEPFVTTKPRGKGRGLGLFVVSQLLESEGSDVFLSGRRNATGRRSEFTLDFTSIVDD